MAEVRLTELPFVTKYRKCFDATWTDKTSVHEVRFALMDSETTGFDAGNDRIVTIGAVTVQNGEILLADSFECLIKLDSNTTAVTVHGVTRDESQKGMDEPAALEAFLDYLKDAVIVGHHIGHDMAALDAAYQRHWGFRLANRCIDTLTLTLLLERDGAFSGMPRIRRRTLGALCEMFQVTPHDRHTAAGDAFITAQIFLRLLPRAIRSGRGSLGKLSQELEETE